jgi:hypothetical protein
MGAQDFLSLLLIRSICQLFRHAILPLTQSLADALNLPIQPGGEKLVNSPKCTVAQPNFLETEAQKIMVRRGSANEYAKRGEVDLLESRLPM